MFDFLRPEHVFALLFLTMTTCCAVAAAAIRAQRMRQDISTRMQLIGGLGILMSIHPVGWFLALFFFLSIIERDLLMGISILPIGIFAWLSVVMRVMPNQFRLRLWRE